MVDTVSVNEGVDLINSSHSHKVIDFDMIALVSFRGSLHAFILSKTYTPNHSSKSG